MEQKSPDEIVCLQIHDLDLAVVAIILPMKLHLAVVDIDQAVVGDGHAMRISAHVVKHLLWSGERAFGVYHPFRFLCTGDLRGESVRIAKDPREAKNCSFPELNASSMRSRKRRRKRRDSTRTERKNRARQRIQRCPSADNPPPGTTQCRWGWNIKFCPQLCKTAKKPISAPMVFSVSAVVWKRMS